MKPFTKLFSSITSSSIWRAPDHVRLVWITMLAMADKDGEIWASVGGLADLARVDRDHCSSALDVLASPDPDSRTKDHEGRRIEAIDGGWRLLNYRKYRELGKNEDRREYFAEYKRQKRSNKKSLSTPCPQIPHNPQMSTSSSASVSSSLSSLERESEGDLSSSPSERPELNLDRQWDFERLMPWAYQLSQTHCVVKRDNWHIWKAMYEKYGPERLMAAATTVPASERWANRVQQALDGLQPKKRKVKINDDTGEEYFADEG